METYNVMIQSNEQKDLLLSSLEPLNYHYDDFNHDFSTDLVYQINPNERTITTQPALHVLEDSNNKILSLNKFLEQKQYFQVQSDSPIKVMNEYLENGELSLYYDQLQYGDFVAINVDGSIFDYFHTLNIKEIDPYEPFYKSPFNSIACNFVAPIQASNLKRILENDFQEACNLQKNVFTEYKNAEIKSNTLIDFHNYLDDIKHYDTIVNSPIQFGCFVEGPYKQNWVFLPKNDIEMLKLISESGIDDETLNYKITDIDNYPFALNKNDTLASLNHIAKYLQVTPEQELQEIQEVANSSSIPLQADNLIEIFEQKHKGFLVSNETPIVRGYKISDAESYVLIKNDLEIARNVGTHMNITLSRDNEVIMDHETLTREDMLGLKQRAIITGKTILDSLLESKGIELDIQEDFSVDEPFSISM